MVLTTPELAPGYALAGATARRVSSVAETTALLRELVQSGEDGVIAVHEPFLDGLPAAERRWLDEHVPPLIVALPGGESADAAGERRARLLQMLWQAVGYRIHFEGTGGDGR